MKKPSEHNYEEITEISKLASEWIDNFYWNEDKIKAFDVASKIVKYLEFYIKDYNLSISDLITRNECQNCSDKDKFDQEEMIKILNKLRPSTSLTEEEKLENSHVNTDKMFDTKFNVDNFVKESLNVNIDDIENVKLCYSLEELSDPKIFQESLDTLNNLDVNMYSGEVTLKNKESK